MSKAQSEAITHNSLVRVQNPGILQSHEDIKTQFVVRNHELNIVLDVLRSNLTAPASQHLLLIAPRGRGKTMLLVRTETELKTNPEFSSHLLPVRLMQESYEIFDIGSFWLELLFHLARAVREVDPSLALELSETHSALAIQSAHQPLHDSARAAVLDAADRLNRRFVLMIENLQSLICGAEKDLGWQLRETLQSEPQIILAASATMQFEAINEADQPFFELFRKIHLKPLNLEECKRLWLAASGESVQVQEIRPLQILTGGNPRLLVICAGFAKHRSLRQLMEELVALVDEHTEYFRGHLEVLPRSERRVFVSLIDLWRPSSTGEIAARARMDVRAVSTMLARLIERGAVTATQLEGSNRKLYAATEPLFSIYYKLRREQDEAAIVENLIVFMLAFYQIDHLGQLLQDILPESEHMPSMIEGMDRALERACEQGAVSSEKATLLRDASQTAKRGRQLSLDRRLLREIANAIGEGDSRKVVELVDRFESAEGLGHADNRIEMGLYLACVKAEAWIQLKEPRKVIELARHIAEQLGEDDGEAIVGKLAWMHAILVNALYLEGEYDLARSSAEEYLHRFEGRIDPQATGQSAKVRLVLAKAENRLGNATRSFEVLDSLINRYSESTSIHLQRVVAEARMERLGSRDAAKPTLAELNAVINAVEGSQRASDRSLKASALLLRGVALGSQGAGDAELQSYREAIRCVEGFDTHSQRLVRVVALFYKGLYEADSADVEAVSNTHFQLRSEVEHCSTEMRPLAEWFDMCLQCVLSAQQKKPIALQSLGLVCGRPISNARFWIHAVIRVVANLLRAEFEADTILAALEEDPENATRLRPLIVALRLLKGESVVEPEQIMEIARDVQARLDGSVPNSGFAL